MIGFRQPNPAWISTLQAAGDGTRALLQAASLAVCAVLLSPLLEEFIFRRYLQQWLMRKIRPIWAVAATAIFFAAAHCDLFSLVPLCCVSICFSIAFIRGGLAASTLAHSLYNIGVLTVALTITD